ncbi:hypothetical protein V6Z12_D10G290300 [Gossypium hirsutum]
MEVSFDVEAVMEFLRKNGLKEAEKALQQDMIEKNEDGEKMGAFDFEKFLFPMPPPVRIPATTRRSEEDEKEKSGDGWGSDGDEFVSLRSSSSDVCSSEFVNPYGLNSASQANSDTSSDRLSQFGTARDYPDFEMQNDLFWHEEKDEDDFMTPCFAGSDFYGCPSQDKFVTTLEMEKQRDNTWSSYDKSEGFGTEDGLDYLDKPCLFNMTGIDGESDIRVMDYYCFDKCNGLEGDNDIVPELKDCAYDENLLNFGCIGSKGTNFDDFEVKVAGDVITDYNGTSECISKTNHYTAKRGSNDWIEGFIGDSDLVNKISEKSLSPDTIDTNEVEDGELNEPQVATNEEGDATDELLMYSNEDEYEEFNLRIVHRKNRSVLYFFLHLPC